MKYFILSKKNKLNAVLNFLIERDNLPKIQRRLNIFSEDDNYRIEIVNNEVSYRNNSRLKKVYVSNKNLKYFFKMFDNKKMYHINDITLLEFKCCSIMFNTYHGTLIATDSVDLCNEIEAKFETLHYDNILDHKVTKKPKKEYLFDEIGNLNTKIKEYAKETGLDIRSVSSSLKIRISNISNDYTYLEEYYKYITRQELLSTKTTEKKKYNISNFSIIIPVYNQNVTYTLLSIQGQNLSKEDKQKLQVIIIDDGSKNNVIEEINQIRNKLDYELQIISLEKNMGLSNARNIGFAITKYEHILFMDSDIILSKNYIYDMSIRLQMIPNALFICMRKNIEKDSEILKEKSLLSGINECSDFDDSRVITKGKEYHIGCDNSYINEEISILDDTNYFKELGYGSQIGIYNISTVVTGHNIALNKSIIKSQHPFSSQFKGWGLEDSYFASKLIADGCFVIPVLSSCVYHINHPPRSGSNQKKNEEALANYNLYNELLNQIWK